MIYIIGRYSSRDISKLRHQHVEWIPMLSLVLKQQLGTPKHGRNGKSMEVFIRYLRGASWNVFSPHQRRIRPFDVKKYSWNDANSTCRELCLAGWCLTYLAVDKQNSAAIDMIDFSWFLTFIVPRRINHPNKRWPVNPCQHRQVRYGLRTK